MGEFHGFTAGNPRPVACASTQLLGTQEIPRKPLGIPHLEPKGRNCQQVLVERTSTVETRPVTIT